MLVRWDGVQNRRGFIRKVAKVSMKKGGLLNPDKARDLSLGTVSRQPNLNSDVGRRFGWILPCLINLTER